MSSKIKGLRRVGIVGLSTVVAASMMTLSAATTFAAAGAYVALSAPNVIQGQTAQVAGNVSLDFANSVVIGATQTFQIKRGTVANDCTTPAGLAAAVSFATAPTAAISGPFLADGTTAGTATPPTIGAVGGPTGSSAACTSNNILDTVTVATTSASTGATTDTFRLTLSNATYKVGATAATGPVALVTSGALSAGPASVNNATVVAVSSFTVSPVITAQSSSLATPLGTVSFVETTAGGLFTRNATTTVTLTHSAGATFTTGTLPTITAPTGWTVVAGALTASSFTFTVNPPTGAALGTVSVSGLMIDADTGGRLVTVTETRTVGTTGTSTVNAAKVLDYNDRTGGADRYSTAAALYNSQFPTATKAILSSGVDFPDALSANYLAGRLATGTLLTRPTTLSGPARLSILNGFVTTVYITGQTGAVSQGVQNQIEALHVGNNPTAAFITVVRLGGSTRFDTNKIINENNFTAAAKTVLLASGQDFPDALALGPIAANKHFPLILTKGVTLGANEKSQLADFNPANVIIAGGPGVVSTGIETSLKAQGFTVTRLAGAGRTETAAAVATYATTLATGAFNTSKTYIARGDDFADALAAGPVAGVQASVIVLTVNTTTLGAGIPSYLGTKTVGTATAGHLHVDSLHALGLTGAVSNTLMRAAAVTVGP